MKQKLLILFISLFFLACLVPMAGLCIAGPAAPAANETRAVTPRLKNWDGSLNDEYLIDLADYISKGFWGRLECITGWNSLCTALTNSTVNEDVILGREEWLFYYTAAEEVSGLSLLSDREIWCCARNLYLMQRYANEQGADFLFVAPNGKYDLYSDYMKPFVTVKDGRNVDRLQALLDEMEVNYSDMYSLFTAQDEILYWHTDSHWNGKGAALAADAILYGLGEQGGFFAGEFEETEPHLGDLYEMVYPTGSYREAEYIPAGGFHFRYESNFRTVNDSDILTSCDGEDGSLLMFRDSFGRNLYPYLAERFGQAEFSRLNNYPLYLVSENDVTDVVVQIGVKNIVYLMRYPAVYPSLERDMGLLDELVQTECQTQVTVEDSEMEGYAKITGTIGPCAVDSPVYLRVNARVYEAMPTVDGFTAYVDAGLDLSNVEVYIKQA